MGPFIRCPRCNELHPLLPLARQDRGRPEMLEPIARFQVR